jgi:ParB-like chromosome segregation protein Spo0J
MHMTVKPQELETAAPFDQLFRIDDQLLAQIVTSMRKDGYHKTKPLKIWKDAFATSGRLVVVDGHTRLAAAKRARIETIPIDARHYASVTVAYLDAVREQITRRNMPRDQIAFFTLRSLQLLREAGGRSPSKAQLATTLGVGTTTIARARAILDKGGDELIRRVLEQELSLFDAYEEISRAREDAASAVAEAYTGRDAKPRMPGKSELKHHNKLRRAEEMFAIRRDEHPDAGAYEAMLDAILGAEQGRSSVDFELDTTTAFDLAYEQLYEAKKRG